MKEIFEIYIDGKFLQHLPKSETRYLTKWFKVGSTITVKCVEVTKERYKILMGK